MVFTVHAFASCSIHTSPPWVPCCWPLLSHIAGETGLSLAAHVQALDVLRSLSRQSSKASWYLKSFLNFAYARSGQPSILPVPWFIRLSMPNDQFNSSGPSGNSLCSTKHLSHCESPFLTFQSRRPCLLLHQK
jgi:hypothetical protein